MNVQQRKLTVTGGLPLFQLRNRACLAAYSAAMADNSTRSLNFLAVCRSTLSILAMRGSITMRNNRRSDNHSRADRHEHALAGWQMPPTFLKHRHHGRCTV